MGTRLSVENIAEAYEVMDPVFRDTPQFVFEHPSKALRASIVLKVETVNPIGSFKGRGTDYLLHRMKVPGPGLVCASAGNFGQGLAYAARKRGLPVTVFAALNATPLKVGRMRDLGADVVLGGEDFDAAKELALEHARATGASFIEDGALPAIAEGAGTIALELCRLDEPLDFLYVPLGNGALISGIGTWMRRASPSTRIVGVVAAGAPAMQRSWRAGRVVTTESTATIADGIAVRVPVAAAVEDLKDTVDDIVAVAEEHLVTAMRTLFRHAALVTEPAGAAGLAAIEARHDSLAGARVGVVVTGGNASAEHLAMLLSG